MALHQHSSPLSIKAIIGLFVTLFLHLTIFNYGASASPISSVETQADQLSKRYTGNISPNDPNSKYPSDDEIRAAYITSSQATVFYSNIGPPDKAQQFAASINGRLLRDSFPTDYTRYSGRGKAGYQNFIDRASGILADNAAGEVFFVGRWDLKVDTCRVWARVEYDSLKANTQVTKITLVNVDDFTQTMDYPGPQSIKNKEKRDKDYCYDWNGDGENPIH